LRSIIAICGKANQAIALKAVTEVWTGDDGHSTLNWNLYDIKLLKVRIEVAKRRGDLKEIRRLEKRLDILWRERFR
jgi:hypothetical protein